METEEAKPQSVLQSKLNENGEQLEKLSSLLYSLGDRLNSLRVSTPTAEAGGLINGMEPGGYSMVVNQVTGQTATIKDMQSYVANLMSELEI